jgi:SprT protein
MINPNKLQAQANVIVRAFTNIINKRFGTSMKVPSVSFNVVGTTAGKAFYNQHLVDLNMRLYMENPSYFFNQTIPHEVAHLASVHIHGNKGSGHGKEWKVIMGLIGREPKQYHSLNIANVKRR